jgi:signal transduction histidine kinase
LFEDNIRVTTRLAAGVPAVHADPGQLKQVLLNLVVNACDAMADNKLGDRGPTIATSCDDRRFAQVSVGDRSGGIAAGVKERMF